MENWTFKTARFDSIRNAELVEIDPKQKSKIKDYEKALKAAAKSVVPNPIFSKFFVKGSIGVVGNNILPAGNIEYGCCQALHAEESAVAVFRSVNGRRGGEKVVLGIIAGKPGNIATPCGNCRDILLEDLGEDFEIVSGAAEGGIAVVTKMNDYLFEDFQEFRLTEFSTCQYMSEIGKIEFKIRDGMVSLIRAGEVLVNDAYFSKDIYPERRYHALIVTIRNNFYGARDVMCDYHPIYALRDAIRQARRARDPFVHLVLLACEDFGGGPPHVMYKDRQHLLELNLQQELLLGKEKDPPVYLATYCGSSTIVKVWKTSAKEWLPLAFGPRNFGAEFIKHLTDYFRNRKER